MNLLFPGYYLDEGLRCWLPDEPRPNFDYSDGDAVERRIFDIVRSENELGTISTDLARHISDWPSKYHLSPLRANLLRPFQKTLRGRILEVGAGCGAITRFLGECGGEVTALEGSRIRGATAAARCRDLKNVQVIIDTFDQLPMQPEFDVVTLVGVLEYARKYFPADGADPIDAMLRHAAGYLKPNGILILAIENQLGLKYFAGCGEDHVGIPMFGIEDRYAHDGIATFGRRELSARLTSAGFMSQSWWYPFPDYKLPNVIASELALSEEFANDFDPIIAPTLERDPQLPNSPLFMMERVWKPVARNGLSADLANSFLVVAGKSQATELAGEADVLYHYAMDRKPAYAKTVVFSIEPDGAVNARQEALAPGTSRDQGFPIAMIPNVSDPFIRGKLWSQRLKEILTTDGWTLDALCQWAQRWYSAVLTEANLAEDRSQFVASRIVPGTLIDAVPRNLIVQPDGKAVFIDQEWRVALPLELGFLLFRGIYLPFLAVGQVATPAPSTTLQATALFKAITQTLGIWIVDADIDRYTGFENDIQTWVSGGAGIRYADVSSFRLNVRPQSDLQRSLDDQVAKLRQQLLEYETQLGQQQRAIVERDQALLGLEGKLSEHVDRIGSLEKEVVLRDAQILQARTAISSTEDKLSLIQRLADKREDRIDQLQEVVTQLEQQLDDRQIKLDRCDKQAKELACIVASKGNHVSLMQARADERELKLTSIEQALALRDEQLADQHTKLAVSSKLAIELTNTLASKENEINLLQSQVEENESQLAALEGVITLLNSQLAGQSQLATQQSCQLTAMTRSIERLQVRINELAGKNKALQCEKETAHGQLTALSDWAHSINTRPASYALRKYSYLLARRAFRALPFDHAQKQKLRDIALKVSKPLRNRLKGHSSTGEPSCAVPLSHVEPLHGDSDEREIFVFSVIDWHFRIQRPQHLAKSFAKKGRRVFFLSNHFVDSDQPGYQIENLDPSLPLFQVKLHVRGAPPIYFAPPTAEAEAMLEEGIAKLMADFGISSTASVVQHAYWFGLVKKLPNSYRIYDCMDHHEGFGNVPERLIEIEKEMLRISDLVIVTSSWLEEFARNYNCNVTVIRNAGEFEHFSKSPDQVFKDPHGRRIIGYYGAIAEWFDVELIRSVAKTNPECLVLLIGNDTIHAQEALGDQSNVQFTGEVPYARLPYYLYAFDVCLLPFQIIPLTLATNPVKVYEYLASGKPVVSVDLPEIAQFGDLVYKAASREDFLKSVSLALSEKQDASATSARRQFAAAQTWDHRIDHLLKAVQDLPMPRISVVVLTFNNLELTKACLDSLLSKTDYPNLEIIIVDNASTDGTQAYLSSFQQSNPDIKVILNEENLGFAAGNNVGLAAATGNFLVVLNNDTVVTRGWAMTLLRHMQHDASVGLVGPVTNNIGNEARIEISYRALSDMPVEARRYTLRNMGKTISMRNAAFFCVMMPRATYQACGPISEDYGRGFFEDDDY